MNEKINKIAQITLLFWLMKIIATTLGETLGDQFGANDAIGLFDGIRNHFRRFRDFIAATIESQNIPTDSFLVGDKRNYNSRN